MKLFLRLELEWKKLYILTSYFILIGGFANFLNFNDNMRQMNGNLETLHF